jgi:hypothetical protein
LAISFGARVVRTSAYSSPPISMNAVLSLSMCPPYGSKVKIGSYTSENHSDMVDGTTLGSPS